METQTLASCFAELDKKRYFKRIVLIILQFEDYELHACMNNTNENTYIFLNICCIIHNYILTPVFRP